MYLFIKRGLDIVLSLLALVILSPLCLAVAVAVHLDSHGTVIFRQRRIGKNGTPFTIYKFRTMRPETPRNTATANLSHAHRYITKVGRFLRQTSLDELPQLLNVLKGDMSFVGPRPVIPEEQDLLSLRRRYGADCLRPGITGLAQIRGRDHLSAPIKAGYDAEYVHNCSFFLDAYIFLSTIWYVLRREGIREGE